MDYVNMRSMLEDPDIQELLMVLGVFERRSEELDLIKLCNSMDKMSTTMEGVISEVTHMSEQLAQINGQKSLQERLTEIVGKVGEEAQEIREKLGEIQQEVKAKSAEIVQGVLDQGILGLQKMTEFFGIKEKLTSMREKTEKNRTNTEIAMERIEQAGNQGRQAMVDVRNVGRSLAGKEMAAVDLEKEHRVERMVMAPMRVCHSFYSILIGQIDKAINSIESLLQKGAKRDIQIEQDDMLDHLIQENEMEIVPAERVETYAVDTMPDIEAYLNAWVAQQKRIEGANRQLLPDKARSL